MARRKSKRTPQRRPQPANSDSETGPGAFLSLIWRNRPGAIGFLLSILQLFLYAAMFGFMAHLVSSGRADELDQDSPESWTVVGLLICGLLTTAVALFLSLYGTIRGNPKTLAIAGLCLSFFVGATVTFVLVIGALNAGNG